MWFDEQKTGKSNKSSARRNASIEHLELSQQTVPTASAWPHVPLTVSGRPNRPVHKKLAPNPTAPSLRVKDLVTRHLTRCDQFSDGCGSGMTNDISMRINDTPASQLR
jgi:hypothetical protein